MLRKIILRLNNPEIALGFVVATVFWIGVLGWQAAYAPSEIERRQCEESAHKSGHKSEDCKTLWERTTSDPVAFFTLWLVIFTAGLTVSTVLLWRAGEKQFGLLSESAATQSHDMRESLEIARTSAKAATDAAYSERAWISPDGVSTSSINNLRVGDVAYAEAIGVFPNWKNTGRSPAIHFNVFTANAVIPIEAPIPPHDIPVPPSEERNGILGPNGTVDGGIQILFGENLAKLKARKVKWLIYSRATYSTVFEPNSTKVSEFCGIVEINGEQRQPDGTMIPRIISSPIGPQNTAT